ncbi:DUF2442 domain-containing protein [candidate division KSB1 bacterium]|nr:DUF2442 domain-containing protein [candidate division KSB1 bacterium]
MEKLYDIGEVTLHDYLLSFKVNGIPVTWNLAKVSKTLAQATPEQVAKMIVDPVGVGFHWPALDEDLSVTGILRDLGIRLPTAKPRVSKQPELT